MIPVEADAPSFVEVTAFDKPSEHRLNISLVTLRQEEEPIPCSAKVRVRLGEARQVVRLRSLPAQLDFPFTPIPGGIEFTVSGFEIFSMFELEYSNL